MGRHRGAQYALGGVPRLRVDLLVEPRVLIGILNVHSLARRGDRPNNPTAQGQLDLLPTVRRGAPQDLPRLVHDVHRAFLGPKELLTPPAHGEQEGVGGLVVRSSHGLDDV